MSGLKADIEKQYYLNSIPWVWANDYYQGKLHYMAAALATAPLFWRLLSHTTSEAWRDFLRPVGQRATRTEALVSKGISPGGCCMTAYLSSFYLSSVRAGSSYRSSEACR